MDADARDPFVEEDIEFGRLEGRGHLIFDDLDFDAVADVAVVGPFNAAYTRGCPCGWRRRI